MASYARKFGLACDLMSLAVWRRVARVVMDPLSAVFSLFSRVVGDQIAAAQAARRRLPWASTRKLAGRLEEIVDKVADGRKGRDRVIAYLCMHRSDLTLTSVEQFMRGVSEPTIEQARDICALTGASFAYLWYGDGEPFSSEEGEWLEVRSYPMVFQDEEVESVLFVRGDRIPHLSYVVLAFDEYRYRVLPMMWHVSSVNGNGGASSLVELANLSSDVHRVARSKVIRGMEVPSEISDAVSHGRLHASALMRKGWKLSYWWDDIADTDHLRPGASNYGKQHGQEFLAAQELIRWARPDA